MHRHGFVIWGVAAATGWGAPSMVAQTYGPGPSDPGLFRRSYDVRRQADLQGVIAASPREMAGDTQINFRGAVGDTPSLADGFRMFAAPEFPNPASFAGEVNVFGGIVGDRFTVDAGEVNVLGGVVGNEFRANAGAFVTISGGSVGNFFTANAGSVVRLEGGSIGVGFNNLAGSDVEIVGGEFVLNGSPYTFSLVFVGPDDVLTGTLEDGSSFVLSGPAGDDLRTVRLTPAALPALNTTPRTVTSDLSGGPSGLRSGQTLTLQEPGVLGNHFAVVDAELNVEGGTVGTGLEVARGGVVNIDGGDVGRAVFAERGGRVNIRGGSVAGAVTANDGGVVVVSGGSVGDSLTANAGSVVAVFGGQVGPDARVNDGGVFGLLGGTVAEGFRVNAGGEFNVSGGEVGEGFEVRPGGELNFSGGRAGRGFTADGASDTELIGGEFRLNGVAFSGSTVTLGTGDIFTGTLADGSSFIFADELSDRLVNVNVTDLGALDVPAIDPTPQFVDTDRSAGPSGLRIGETLTVDGGQMGEALEATRSTVNVEAGTVGGRVAALAGSEFNVRGGVVGDGFEAFRGSVVNLSGGEVGDDFSAMGDAEVNVSGGRVGDRMSANGDSRVTVSGGEVGEDFAANDGSRVVVSGGTIGAGFVANDGSDVKITGGDIGPGFVADSGSLVNVQGGVFRGTATVAASVNGSELNVAGGLFERLNVDAGSELNLVGGTIGVLTSDDADVSDVEIVGGGFTLNGQAINDATITLAQGDVLTGTLSDGSPFIFVGDGGTGERIEQATLTRVEPVPADTTPRVVDTFVSGGDGPSGVRAGQSLTVVPGGELHRYYTVVGGTLNVDGGVVHRDFEAARATVNLSAGRIDRDFRAFEGTQIQMSGGAIGEDAQLRSGSVLTMSDGQIADDLRLSDGSVLNLSGGAIGETMRLSSGSVLNMSGGNVEFNFRVTGGSEVNLTGGQLGMLEVDPFADSDRLFGFELRGGGSTITVSDGFLGADGQVSGGARLEVVGGEVGNGLTVGGGGIVNVRGGFVAGDIWAFSGQINVSGGEVGDRIDVRFGTLNLSGGRLGDGLTVGAGGTFNIFGTEFFLDGVLLDTLALDEAFLIAERGGAELSGVLADGSDFGFTLDGAFAQAGTVTVTRVEARLAGDFNGSGIVEQGDLDLVLTNWGGARGFEDGVTTLTTPNVDQEELDLVLTNWGSSTTPSFAGSNVPEPVAAIGLGLLGFLVRRRRAA